MRCWGLNVAPSFTYWGLGHEKPRDAVMRHCKGAVKHGILSNGGSQVDSGAADDNKSLTICRVTGPSSADRWRNRRPLALTVLTLWLRSSESVAGYNVVSH